MLWPVARATGATYFRLSCRSPISTAERLTVVASASATRLASPARRPKPRMALAWSSAASASPTPDAAARSSTPGIVRMTS
jgi:hypothetical protein